MKKDKYRFFGGEKRLKEILKQSAEASNKAQAELVARLRKKNLNI